MAIYTTMDKDGQKWLVDTVAGTKEKIVEGSPLDLAPTSASYSAGIKDPAYNTALIPPSGPSYEPPVSHNSEEQEWNPNPPGASWTNQLGGAEAGEWSITGSSGIAAENDEYYNAWKEAETSKWLAKISGETDGPWEHVDAVQEWTPPGISVDTGISAGQRRHGMRLGAPIPPLVEPGVTPALAEPKKTDPSNQFVEIAKLYGSDGVTEPERRDAAREAGVELYTPDTSFLNQSRRVMDSVGLGVLAPDEGDSLVGALTDWVLPGDQDGWEDFVPFIDKNDEGEVVFDANPGSGTGFDGGMMAGIGALGAGVGILALAMVFGNGDDD